MEPTTGLRRLQLPGAVKSGVRAYKYMRMKHESPWKTYEKIYQLRLGVGDRVTVAEGRVPHPRSSL